MDAYNRYLLSASNENRKRNGGGLSCVSILFSVLTGIYCFNLENFNEFGQGNYCRIRDDATETLLRGCAAARFNALLGTCPLVYIGNDNDTTDIHEKFNIILLLLFIGWTSPVASGILKIMEFNCLANLLVLPEFVSIAGFFMIHIYRFRMSGEFCSGKYNPDNYSDAPLKSKGSFLLGYMITMWVFIGLWCCLCCVYMLALKQAASQRGR